MRGGTPGGRTDEVNWLVAIDLEEAMLDDLEYYVLSLDYFKLYDSIPWQLTWELLERAGMPKPLVKMIKGIYEHFRRAFRIGKHVGPFWKATNGFGQGDALSVTIGNFIVAVWAHAMEQQNP